MKLRDYDKWVADLRRRGRASGIDYKHHDRNAGIEILRAAGWTFEEIGGFYGITGCRVSQLRRRMLEKRRRRAITAELSERANLFRAYRASSQLIYLVEVLGLFEAVEGVRTGCGTFDKRE